MLPGKPRYSFAKVDRLFWGDGTLTSFESAIPPQLELFRRTQKPFQTRGARIFPSSDLPASASGL
jgi:hypothetical protein